MEWARQQIELAEQRVQQGTNINDEAVLDQFKTDFLHTWRDTSLLERGSDEVGQTGHRQNVTMKDYNSMRM